MKNAKLNHDLSLVWFIKYLFIPIYFMMGVSEVLADGSKDLYPQGVRGNRAFLISRLETLPVVNFPFPNLGTHYVYLKEGETLAVASSAAYVGDGTIEVTKPNGSILLLKTNPDHEANHVGLIRDNGKGTRHAELAGPRVGYRPWELPVASSEEGVWKVEFIAPLRSSASVSNTSPKELADGDWTQENKNTIAAWDVSVRDVTNQKWVSGRVYTNVMSFQISSGQMSNSAGAFYGVNYVLTNDGYVYKVDANGSNGVAYSYFVNNKGFIDEDGNPIYKSVNDIGQIIQGGVHDPRKPDTDLLVTHKIMYTLPDMSMPEEATGAVPGGKTWLITPKRIAKISDIRVDGVEGGNMVTKKGAYISFNTNVKSSYRIQIQSSSPQFSFANRDIIVEAEVGDNRFYWDGLDGHGRFMPVGKNYPIKVVVEMLVGEIHFPYIDMEINPQGILISRLSDNLVTENDVTVYWDDSDIPDGLPSENPSPKVNLQGIPSSINGHKWGTYKNRTINQNTNDNYGDYSYGNNMAIDTWTYALSLNATALPEITVKVADLLIEKIEVDKDTVELGEEVTYTVVVKNGGPSDAIGSTFNFMLPDDFYIRNIDDNSLCGQVVSKHIINDNQVIAQVDLPYPCEIAFVIRASSKASVSRDIYGYYIITADVARPRGVTDPDATSTNVQYTAPMSSIEECNGDDGCNNIMFYDGVFLLEPPNERGQMALIKSAEHVDTNNDGYPQVGERVRYTFVLQNIGEVPVRDITMRDDMLSDNLISFARQDLSPGEETTLVLYYTITQADMDRGKLINTATVFGKNPRGVEVKDISGITFIDDLPTELEFYKGPDVVLRKMVSNQGTGQFGQFMVGDVIRYKFDIVNRGKIAIGGVMIEDPMLVQSQMAVGTLSAGQSVEIFGDYEIVTSDIDRGYVENTAWLLGIDSHNGQKIRVQSGTSFDNQDATVTPLAQPPIAIADDFIQYMNVSASYDVLENDKSGSVSIQGSLIEIVRSPNHGTVRVESDGHITYAPSVGFIGEDNFSYRFVDANRLTSNSAEVNITMVATEVISVQDYFELDYNGYVDLDVLRNDYTIGGSTLDVSSLQLVKFPSDGIATVGTDGYVRYVPSTNFIGEDSFTYRIMDSNGIWSEVATVKMQTKDMRIPNVITPNGDGQNDTFVVLGTYAFERVSLDIVDRYGKPVYSSDSYMNDWGADGHEDGAYYYVITGFNNGKKVFYNKGTVTVMRILNY